MEMFRYVEKGTETPTDPLGSPTEFARERIRAAKGMLLRKCRHDEVARQLTYALEALDLAHHYAGRPRIIRGWSTF